MAGPDSRRSQTFDRRSLPVLLGLLLAAGCSNPKEPLSAVTGTITVDKQPLSNGTVVFHPDRDKGNMDKRLPRGTIRSDSPGSYRLTTDKEDGAPSGWYKVTINALKPSTSSLRPPDWLADQRYADEKTSGLSVEVVKDAPAQTFDFDLQPPP